MAKYQDVIIAGFGGQGVMLIGNCWPRPVWNTASK